MLRRAWVFRCDRDGCKEFVMGYSVTQKAAIEAAEAYGWKIERYASSYYCYCPSHAASDPNRIVVKEPEKERN